MIEEHFTPAYLPWRERLAVVPDGKASVVTDQITQCKSLERTDWTPEGTDCVGVAHDGFPEARR